MKDPCRASAHASSTRPTLFLGPWTAVAAILIVLAPTPGTAIAQEPSEVPTASDTFAIQGKKKFRKRQARPVELGASGGNFIDVSDSHCCSGTLGALLEKNGVQYILSNNHVIARANDGTRGEPIIQPGLIDQQRTCIVSDLEADTVAELSAKKRLKFGGIRNNKVDAAIAEVRPGAVDPSGSLVGLGIPGDTPIDPEIGMEVVKVGRTTGLRRGVIISVNVTVPGIEYPTECGSDDTRIARFVKQFVIMGVDKRFSKGGDSGAVVYEDSDVCPAPVGLLFAGGVSGGEPVSLASPIKFVQRSMSRRPPRGDVSFVGCSAAAQGGWSSSSLARRRPLIDKRQVELASRVTDQRAPALLEVPGVEAIGVGMSLSGPVEPAIYVFVSAERAQMLEHLPAEVDGYRVEVLESGRFVAQ